MYGKCVTHGFPFRSNQCGVIDIHVFSIIEIAQVIVHSWIAINIPKLISLFSIRHICLFLFLSPRNRSF